MEREINLNNYDLMNNRGPNNRFNDYFAGQTYHDFIDYAFEKADYFMLVYKQYSGKGYLREEKQIMDALQKFKYRRRMDPSWPGTPGMYDLKMRMKYKIIFYHCDPEAKEILKTVRSVYDWVYPYPEDLAFFKGNQCWFYSTAHEYLASVVHATDEDVDFFISSGLASRKDVRYANAEWLESLDETFLA